jgi:hypothetical protein
MAFPDIDDAFVKQFESEAHVEYQQMGSKLRNTIRTKAGITGESTTFQVIGNVDVGTKTREGRVPRSHPTHAPVEVTLQDRYASVLIDDLDELKIQHDERGVQAKNIAAAMGKDTDDIILTAFDASANSNNVSTAETFSAASTPIGMMEDFGNSSIPFDGELYAVVCWEAWGDLLDLDEFSNADYVPSENLWFEGVTAKTWLGFKWFPHENLPVDGSSDAKNFFYHRTSCGHAIGQDYSQRIDFLPEFDSNQVMAKMSHGAGLIDDTGCIERVYNSA